MLVFFNSFNFIDIKTVYFIDEIINLRLNFH